MWVQHLLDESRIEYVTVIGWRASCAVGDGASRAGSTTAASSPACGSACASESFFFSSRRRHTRFDCDWSSDVCSSDLLSQPWRRPEPHSTASTTRSSVRAVLTLSHADPRRPAAYGAVSDFTMTPSWLRADRKSVV